MTDAVTIALIVAIPPTLAGLAAVIVAVRTRHKIADLTVHINSRMDQLLKTKGELGEEIGRAKGIAEERQK